MQENHSGVALWAVRGSGEPPLQLEIPGRVGHLLHSGRQRLVFVALRRRATDGQLSREGLTGFGKILGSSGLSEPRFTLTARRRNQG